MGSLPRESGTLVINSVASPAAGAFFEVFTAPGVQMRIIGLFCNLATSVVVADRRVYYEIRDATRIVSRVVHGTVQTAGTSACYSIWSGVSAAPFEAATYYVMPFPENYVQQLTFNLRVGALNIDVGDTFSAIAYAAEEWMLDF